MRFLSKYKNARLMIMGPLAFDKAKYEPGQIIIKKPVRYGWLPYWIKQCRITIAPLQNTSFNECKSALKFFESAIWGVPVVASPIPDMLRFQDTDIMFAHNGKEWQDCFEALYYSEHYDLISRNIQKYADEQCMAAFQVDSWLAFLRQSIEKLSNQT